MRLHDVKLKVQNILVSSGRLNNEYVNMMPCLAPNSPDIDLVTATFVNTGVMAVKAELVVLLLYSAVQTATVSPEADAEQVFILSRVSEQEAALRLVFQQMFCLVNIDCWRFIIGKCT